MAFPLAPVEFLMLCMGRLLDLFGCSIGVHTVEHGVDGSVVVCLTYKVTTECRSALTDWSEKAE